MAMPTHKHPQGLAVIALSYFKWQVILMNTPTLTSSIIVNVKVLQLEELLISNIYIAWQKVLYKNKCLKHLLQDAKKKIFGRLIQRFFECFSSWRKKTTTCIFFYNEDNFCGMCTIRKPQSSLMSFNFICRAYSHFITRYFKLDLFPFPVRSTY